MDWQYDPLHPDFDRNVHQAFRQLREEAPVYYWETGRAWLVSRQADVLDLLRDRRLSLNPQHWRHYRPMTPELLHTPFMQLHRASLLGQKDADHTRLRRLISPAFTPRATERLRPALQAIVDELLAAYEPGELFDLADSFAEKLPVRAISSMLGIPAEHDPQFRRFSYAVLQCTDPQVKSETFAAANVDIAVGVQMLRELISQRRQQPGEDLLSTLLQVEEQGEKVSPEEVVSLLSSMITAGSETTTHMICFVVNTLLRHPDQLQLLLDDPSLIGSAIEEALRFDNIGRFGTAPRYTREEIEVAGVRIPKGEQVIAVLTSGQRDETVFEHADRFDLRRDTPHNMPFGVGPHHCLGAALARLEGQVAIGTLLRRYPKMQLAGEPQLGPHPFLRRIVSMPLQLAPAPTAA